MSHRHQRKIERVFIAGELHDLPAIRQRLSELGPDAYGQVFIETLHADDVTDVAAPGRVTVTWLARSGGISGAALAQVVSAWMAEWMPDEVDPEERHTVWVGADLAS